MKLRTLAMGSLIALSAGTAIAGDSYVCVNGDAERKISVVYTQPGFTVPCEVVYEKASGMQTLWRAENEEGYCEEKAKAFAEKQASWGFECNMMSEQAAAAN
ncbi:hypothetical protein [Litoribrevibacter albus]|uniref:Uncharacterized protein n=1 Tax=Litoribrevibacter albus TaxID=1473156 RepID=A0AA37S9W5_9GAMM|nr:hypothetical protein [Litoribrevibacter albus]GLQ30814.1 hypothetical protein GCM10007876_12930 [Litoribrevibacter albus]